MSWLSHTACVHHTDEGEGHHHLPAKQLAAGQLRGYQLVIEAACSGDASHNTNCDVRMAVMCCVLRVPYLLNKTVSYISIMLDT
jgi:hypothetical protein